MCHIFCPIQSMSEALNPSQMVNFIVLVGALSRKQPLDEPDEASEEESDPEVENT